MKTILLMLLSLNVLATGPKTYTTRPTRTLRAKGFLKKRISMPKHSYLAEARIQIPNVVDLSPGLTPIRDQGQCGSCFAFSQIRSLEDGLKASESYPGPLSQQWLMDAYAGKAACNGGGFDAADKLQNPGPPLLSTYPYVSGATGVGESLRKGAKSVAKIGSWQMLGGDNGPTPYDIAAFLVSQKRPLSISVYADDEWEAYSGGVYNGCSQGQPNHMVNIAGINLEGKTFDANGKLPAGYGQYLVVNQWTTAWGQKGFMWTKITDEQGNLCNNVAEEASAFFLPTPRGGKK